ncbi:AbrB/MazE/SpoVT family DNA-binding domain-containing protein [uncultured Methanobrevibacter sp.]|uniref:AbrB/MazE/SpoVT family DNA-binding domain-containing protein n=1 Tax=uncultured Methanobrevibacter sp. TaxID=253161 RepID=UPI00320A439E
MIMGHTKVYKNFQTSIPKEVRETFGVNNDTIVEWGIDENGELKVNFRKKVNVEDIIGLIKTEEPTNSVELKKELYK